MFDDFKRKWNEFMTKPIPYPSEIYQKWHKKHHPIEYVTDKYVESLNLEENKPTDFDKVSNTLVKLGTAEKNYSQNKPGNQIGRKIIGVLGSIISIFCITHAEQFDTFNTKAWPFAFKERDQD